MALVTGGSRGIGAAISRELGVAGARVAVNYRSDQAAADEIAGEIGGLLARPVVERHIGARLRELTRDRRPDPPRPAGDKGDPPVE